MEHFDFNNYTYEGDEGTSNPNFVDESKRLQPGNPQSGFSGGAPPHYAVNSPLTDNPDSTQKVKNLLSIEYYMQYFNVDTNQVISRITYATIPSKGKQNFILDVIEGNPDMYGPIWILFTLVLTIAMTGSFVQFVNTYGEQNHTTDFAMLTGCLTLLSIYNVFVPFGLYSYLWYSKTSVGYTFAEIFCTYGYAWFVMIPVSFLFIFQVPYLKFVLTVAAMILSGRVLYQTFWPALTSFEKRGEAYGVMILVIMLHILMIFLLKTYYLDQFIQIDVHSATIAPALNVTTKLSVTTTTSNFISTTIAPVVGKITQALASTTTLISNITTIVPTDIVSTTITPLKDSIISNATNVLNVILPNTTTLPTTILSNAALSNATALLNNVTSTIVNATSKSVEIVTKLTAPI